MSAYDDPESQERRDLSEARETARILRELQEICKDPDQQGESLDPDLQSMLEEYLSKAERLLGGGETAVLTSRLRSQLALNERVSRKMIRERIPLIASVLESRFLGPGGGYSGQSFSITLLPEFGGLTPPHYPV